MNKRYIYFFCIFLIFFSGCSAKKNNTDPRVEKLSKLGVVMKLPENFIVLPQEVFVNLESLKSTVLDVEPFTVNPIYAYADNSGKGIIIVSELKFMDGIEPERFAMNNLYTYRKNLEDYLAAGEITSEEMGNDDITTVLLAMVFNEDDDDIFLFKGLNYIYPNLYFMLDLYVIDKEITESDALGYIDMFNSLSIY